MNKLPFSTVGRMTLYIHVYVQGHVCWFLKGNLYNKQLRGGECFTYVMA